MESAEQVIAGTRTEQKIAEETAMKRDRKPKTASAPDDVPSRRVKPETVNGTVAATSASGN